jgi:hypothetical protein
MFIVSDYIRFLLENILNFRIFYLTSIRNIGYYYIWASQKPCRPGAHGSPKGYENGRLT